MMSAGIDKTMAIAIARRLLEQHFVINEIDVVLEGNMWIVTGQVQLFDMRDVRKIRIDVATGEIRRQALENTSKQVTRSHSSQNNSTK